MCYKCPREFTADYQHAHNSLTFTLLYPQIHWQTLVYEQRDERGSEAPVGFYSGTQTKTPATAETHSWGEHVEICSPPISWQLSVCACSCMWNKEFWDTHTHTRYISENTPLRLHVLQQLARNDKLSLLFSLHHTNPCGWSWIILFGILFYLLIYYFYISLWYCHRLACFCKTFLAPSFRIFTAWQSLDLQKCLLVVV